MRVPVPVGWAVHVPDDGAVALALTAPPEPGAFAATVVVSTDDLPAGTALRDWQREVDRALPRLLHDAVLLDLEHVQLMGAPAVRRLLHHVTADGDAVTAEQWATVVPGRDTGVTVTVTVPTPVWADVGPSLRSVVAGIATSDVAAEGGVR